MANFEQHIEPLIIKEGGYKLINIKHDRGGQTYSGISRNNNPDWVGWSHVDANRRVPKEAVHDYYKRNYWDPLELDSVPSEYLSEILFSCSVLSGPRVATRLLQMVVGSSPDGVMGPNTLKTTLSELKRSGEEVLVLRFTIARIARFSRIVDKNKTQDRFFRGWVNRCLRELGELK